MIKYIFWDLNFKLRWFVMKIRVYSTPTCSHCRDLKRFLDEKGIEYEEIDVSRERDAAKEMVEKSGQLGVPVMDVDGKIVVGFDREKVKETLGI